MVRSVELVDAHRFGPAVPEDDYVYGACCPGWHSAGSHRKAIDEWLSFMRDSDIERVVCLLTGRQLDNQEANIGRYRDEFGRNRVLHAPIPDYRLAYPSQLNGRIIPFLEESVRMDERVVVHCLSGIGRTGQVLAAWLVADRDYTARAAIRKVKQSGRDPTEAIRRGYATEGELIELLQRVTHR